MTTATRCKDCDEVINGTVEEHEKTDVHMQYLEEMTDPAKYWKLEIIFKDHPDLKVAVGYMDPAQDRPGSSIKNDDRPFMAAKAVRHYYFNTGWAEYGVPEGIPKTVGEFCKLAKIPNIMNERERIRTAELEEGAKRKVARS